MPNQKKVFITGSGGFIGKNLLERLKKKYDLSHPRSSYLDLRDIDKVKSFLKKNKFDVVIHCAITPDDNVVLVDDLEMFMNLYTSCGKTFDRLIYYGSGAEFNKKDKINNAQEKDIGINVPCDNYGYGKYIMNTSAKMKQNVFNLRIFGCYGKYEDYSRRFISKSICRLLYGLPIVVNDDVQFSYLLVDDLIRITEMFMNKDKFQFSDYNCTDGKQYSLSYLANIIKELMKSNLEIKTNKNTGKNYTGTNYRLQLEDLHFKYTDIRDGIQKMIDFYSKRKNKINVDKVKEV